MKYNLLGQLGIAGERKVFDFGDPTEFKLLMEYLNKLDKIYNK